MEVNDHLVSKDDVDDIIGILNRVKVQSSEAGYRLNNDQLIKLTSELLQDRRVNTMTESFDKLTEKMDGLVTVLNMGIDINTRVGLDNDVFEPVERGLSEVSSSLDGLDPEWEKYHLEAVRKNVVNFRRKGNLVDRCRYLCDGRTVNECLEIGITKEELDKIREKYPDIVIYDDEEIFGKKDEA